MTRLHLYPLALYPIFFNHRMLALDLRGNCLGAPNSLRIASIESVENRFNFLMQIKYLIEVLPHRNFTRDLFFEMAKQGIWYMYGWCLKSSGNKCTDLPHVCVFDLGLRMSYC
jgi:hypothetical protein